MPPISPGLRPFSEGGYRILGADLVQSRKLAIHSADPLPPRCGDRFTVAGDGVVHEVSVVELDRHEGGWSAVCRVTDVF
jgi:hypothetical protein